MRDSSGVCSGADPSTSDRPEPRHTMPGFFRFVSRVVGFWHMTAFAATHHLGRDWTTTDKGWARG